MTSGAIASADVGSGLSRLARDVWGSRMLVFLIMLAFTSAGVAYSLLAPSWYRASVLLVPADEKKADNLAGQLGGIVSLAGLAGISVGGGNTAEAIAVLRSRELTGRFIQEQQLLPVLFASRWDPGAKKWRDPDPAEQPDLRKGIRYFDERIRFVREDKVSGLVTLIVEWTDPELAALWANELVRRVNDTMRARALEEAEANVKYLRQELAATSVVTLQTAISRLLETELQKLMLARGNAEFAFRVVDSAQVPELRSWPPRLLICALSVLLGGIAGVLFVSLRSVFARRGAS